MVHGGIQVVTAYSVGNTGADNLTDQGQARGEQGDNSTSKLRNRVAFRLPAGVQRSELSSAQKPPENNALLHEASGDSDVE